MKIRHIGSVNSTNTYLKEHPEEVDSMTMLVAREQYAGRGQRGNFWEAEPGKNLTFSFRFKPEGLKPIEQFAISEAVALAITDYLKEEFDPKVKWPNDIYVGNRKIAGILIEHSIMGNEISNTIVGIGLNINQTDFRSDAPNPVSMSQLSGMEYNLEEEASRLGACLECRLASIVEEDGRNLNHRDYLQKLWRNDGAFHPFVDNRNGETFQGRIEDVEPSGLLVVKKESGHADRFAFKEVSFVI